MMLRSCAADRTPFDGPVPANEAIHWVEPGLVAEVTFTGWTNEPHLRHAGREVTRSKDATGQSVYRLAVVETAPNR